MVKRKRILPAGFEPLATRYWIALFTFAAALCILFTLYSITPFSKSTVYQLPLHADESIQRCAALKSHAGPSPDFHSRHQSDRYVPGTPPTLLTNARIWTGNDNGTEVIEGGILLDKGIIKEVGILQPSSIRARFRDALVEMDLNGSWGVGPTPGMSGANDGNSLKGVAQPWLRSLDAINTHDASYHRSISGGNSLSLNRGQSFVIKLRSTHEKTPSSMLLEPPVQVQLHTTRSFGGFVPWRHIKHACARVYGGTRMDTTWAFRQSYTEAQKLLHEQDDYCTRVEANEWEGLGRFPEDLKWEALVDVLRGRTKVNIHCYEAVDIDGMVRLSNEFKFPIAAFHHAHEAYLMPKTLKKAYGETPGVAIFASFAHYKREAYRGSEFAAKILASHGIDVSFKTDHSVHNSVMDSRFLTFEAQQGHYYGFAPNLALSSITTTSAKRMGLDHRLGYVRQGWDADLVIWDSHPLNLRATPRQVFVDGIAQLEVPVIIEKEEDMQEAPKVPDFNREANAALKWDGLPPLEQEKVTSDVLFINISSVYIRQFGRVQALNIPTYNASALFRAGELICVDNLLSCIRNTYGRTPRIVNLHRGSILPGLTLYGPSLGLVDIGGESSTNDGIISSPPLSSLVKGDHDSRDMLEAYVFGGVTTAIAAPVYAGLIGGLGVAFSLGVQNKLERGAVVKHVTSLHVRVSYGRGANGGGSLSVSTQIGLLRKLLLGSGNQANGGFEWFTKAANGELPLVVEADNADIIASLILLKAEVEATMLRKMRMVISGGEEAHLLARQLAEAGVGVIVSPVRSLGRKWETRRILPGVPLTNETVITKLLNHNVTVGIGVKENWMARNLRFEIGYAAVQAGGTISKETAIELGSTNVENLLGLDSEAEITGDLVAIAGGELFEFGGKVVGVILPRLGRVDLFGQ
ncbi:carbohydrate esterase family 9 protein [Flagelloscypha sp. PMI_526]|nr:carbohydrate esterase family 9 protein [Flagelloscypha sp. PMI_526]